jgi:long-chain acyl-CoA synthetase
VPFAAIETTPGIQDLVRQSLAVYNVPVAFTVVVELPRNPALMVSLPDVAALYQPRANR